MIPSVTWRSHEELGDEAERFLDQYHASRDLPVPIEEIAEFDLGLEIRPIWALRERFGVEGFVSVDLSVIVVDEALMVSTPGRYRFTIAHQVGHLILHAEQVGSLTGETTDQWKTAVQSISPRDYGRMEFQAYEFAGCVLVPRRPLLVC